MVKTREGESRVRATAQRGEGAFRGGGGVSPFAESMELVDADPVRYSRDASRYVRDVFDHYGKTTVRHPWGEFTRFSLFDQPWEPTEGRSLPRGALIGQEHVQEEIYRALSNFVREGRPNRLVLLHGPNGSAKSTIAACIMAALEHYSTLDEGALYRVHWVFPSQKTIRGSLGFCHDKSAAAAPSYAHP